MRTILFHINCNLNHIIIKYPPYSDATLRLIPILTPPPLARHYLRMHDHALLLFSGGQDSGTCLAWALERFPRVTTMGFDYGQRHSVEMACRLEVRAAVAAAFPHWGERLGDDVVLRTDFFGQIEATALTAPIPVEEKNASLPNTFVPGRNLIFFTLAAAWAYAKGPRHVVAGACETDSSGYPDCRDDAVKAMQVALNAGMNARFAIHTPLMWLTKAQTWRLAHDLGGDALVDILLEHTHTCYLGSRDIRREWGYGCGECPACRLRAAGYAEYRTARRRT